MKDFSFSNLKIKSVASFFLIITAGISLLIMIDYGLQGELNVSQIENQSPIAVEQGKEKGNIRIILILENIL